MNPDNIDGWCIDVAATLSGEVLSEIKEHLYFKGYLVGLHSHYRGGRGPTPIAFDDFDPLEEYLTTEVKPGDKLAFWALPSGDPLFFGKWPNEKGEVPRGGAY